MRALDRPAHARANVESCAVAWSSVENAGVIGAGFAVAMVGEAVGSKQLVAVGLLAGTLQVITHAAAKSLLFVSVNAVETGLGTTNLDQLQGLIRGAQLKLSADDIASLG